MAACPLMDRMSHPGILGMIAVFVGSGIGGVGRVWLAEQVTQRFGPSFPWGVLLVNVTGSFLIGWLATAGGPDGRWASSALFRQFFMLGLCGGFTTFSSFSLQTLDLIQGGQGLRALANIALSVLLCLAGVWLGRTAGDWTGQGAE